MAEKLQLSNSTEDWWWNHIHDNSSWYWKPANSSQRTLKKKHMSTHDLENKIPHLNNKQHQLSNKSQNLQELNQSQTQLEIERSWFENSWIVELQFISLEDLRKTFNYDSWKQEKYSGDHLKFTSTPGKKVLTLIKILNWWKEMMMMVWEVLVESWSSS